MSGNMKKHDCNQVMQRVHLALDGELSRADMEDFLSEIDSCSHCLEHYNIEKSFKDFLLNKLDRKAAPEACKADIKRKISQFTGGGIGLG
jgi:anti-sigma factor (TIGR02949 family)